MVARVPILADHVLAGRPVVPLALQLAWLVRAAQALQPGLVLQRVSNLRVLRPLALNVAEREVIAAAGAPQWAGMWCAIEAELRATTAKGDVEARAASLHSRASILLGDETESAPLGFLRPVEKGERISDFSALGPADVYPALLFHGTALQLLREVTTCSPAGARAQARNETALNAWGLDAPMPGVDLAAIDAALQLGIVWCQIQRSIPALPLCIGEYIPHHEAPVAGLLDLVLRVTDSSAHRLRADVEIGARESGAPGATLRGVEWTCDASLAAAFAATVQPAGAGK